MKPVVKTATVLSTILVTENLFSEAQAIASPTNGPHAGLHLHRLLDTGVQNSLPSQSANLIVLFLLVVICILLALWIARERRNKRSAPLTPEEAIHTLYLESQTILKALPVGIAIYNKEARQEYINDAVATLFGVSDKEAHLAKQISLFEDPILTDEIKEGIRQGKEIDAIVEYDLRKASGASYFATDLSHIMYIDGKIRYVKNENGEIDKYILILNDITRERIHELQLRRSELNLKLVLEASESTVWRYDIRKSGFYPIQGKMLTHEGATFDAVCSQMHKDSKKSFITMMDDLLSGRRKEGNILNRIVCTEDRDRYYKTRAIAIHTPEGELEAIIGSHKNITEDYYHKQELEESLFKIQLAIQSSDLVQWNYDCRTHLFSSLNETVVHGRTNLGAEDYLRVVHPEDQGTIARMIGEMDCRKDARFSQDLRIKWPGHDDWQYVRIDGAPIKDRHGEVIKFTGFQRNNTEHTRLNAQLSERNIHLSMILRAGSILPMAWHAGTDLVHFSSGEESPNPDPLHQSSTAVALETFLSNIHPNDRARIRNMFDDLKNGVLRNACEECRYDPEGRFEEIYDMNYTGIDYDKNGRPSKAVGYLQDITERKKGEIRIKKQKEFMSSIFDKLPIPLYIKDMENDCKYIYWNEASRKLWGEGLYKSTGEIIDEHQAKTIEAIDRKVFDTEEPYINEEKIKTRNGTEHDTIVHKSVVHDDRKKLLLVVRWDIGQRNELQRKSKVLSISMNALKAYTWYYDLRDKVLRFGDEFEKIGANPSEINSMWKFAQKIHPEQRARYLAFIENFCTRESGDFSVEYEIDLTNSGQYEWWECRGTMEIVSVGNTSYKYLYGMDINIDAHKRTELAILKNKTELDVLNTQNELILNNTNSGLVFLDNDYTVQWENLSSFLPHHPMTRNYRKGISCYKVVKGLDEPCTGCVVARSRVSGKMESKELTHNGMTAELTATPIYDDSRRRVGTVLKVVDITENKRVHRELEAAKLRAETANALMTNIIDCLPCLLFIKDAADDYRYVSVNKYFCRVLDKTAEEILGKTDYELFPTREEAERCRRDDRIAVEENRLHIFEEETTFQDKRIVWQTTKTSVKTSDGRHLLIAVSLDITEKMLSYNELQEAKEKAEQSNRLKSAFLANMSHEIRTPLNAIVGFSELLTDTTDSAEKEEFSTIIQTNNELLLRLINDILDLSKIEAGMIELKPERFDVADLFRELFVMFEKRVTAHEVELVCENPYGSCIVEFDRNRFMQLLTNFLTNAIKFTTEGEIRMGYEVMDDGLRVFVADTGIGIAKDKQEKVFERFEKLDDFAQGTGLGMAICKAIVETHHGKIGVDSEAGRGSTFWAWLPVKVRTEG